MRHPAVANAPAAPEKVKYCLRRSPQDATVVAQIWRGMSPPRCLVDPPHFAIHLFFDSLPLAPAVKPYAKLIRSNNRPSEKSPGRNCTPVV